VKYPKEKFKMFKRKTFNLAESSDSNSSSESEMIAQLKGKFHVTRKKSENVQILTVLPKYWSIRKIQQEFKVSNYMVQTSTKLVAEKGILSSPNVKPNKCCFCNS
jgi:CTP-dependent riboflavin kinase